MTAGGHNNGEMFLRRTAVRTAIGCGTAAL